MLLDELHAIELPGFYALTGCDTTSTFFVKGKKSAYSVCQKNGTSDNLFWEMSGQTIDEYDIR